MSVHRIRTRTALAAGLVILACANGCAHRRDAYYARDTGPGVSVRAPFVNVQVEGKSKSKGTVAASRDRDDGEDDNDRKFSRLPVDRED